MKTIIVGSENPGKIEAVRIGFTALFPEEEIVLRGIAVPSGVAEQPLGDEETLQGAKNRAENARKEIPDATYFVGLEGGITDTNTEMAAFAWIVIISQEGKVGKGKTGTFFLPTEIATLIRSGIELGEANDMFFGTKNSKHAGGAVGILTKEALNRPEYYAQAVILALIPHINNMIAFDA